MFESWTTPPAEVARRVKLKPCSYPARTVHPANKKSLFVDVRPTKPRCLTASRFLCAVDVTENSPPPRIRLGVASPNAPLLGARLHDPTKRASQRRFPIDRCEHRAALDLTERSPNGLVQRVFILEGRRRGLSSSSTPHHRSGRCFALGGLALVHVGIGWPPNSSSTLSAFGDGCRPWCSSGRRRTWANQSMSGLT